MSAFIQNTLIILGLLGLAAFAYYLLVIQDGNLLNSTTGTVDVPESQIFLSQLNLIKGVSLETEIFSNETFRSLVNQSATVREQPVGRDNPFILQNQSF